LIPFVNIHTHNLIKNADVINLVNVDQFEVVNNGPFSLGIHPWKALDISYADLEKVVLSKMQNPNFLAMGECGLDRIHKINFEVQKKVFEKQILLALSINKPLLIHCVKAYDEVYDLKKKRASTLPFIFHRYNASIDQFIKLNSLHCYFSFGSELLNPTEKVKTIIKQVPINTVFFETDDTQISIYDVYSAYAQLSGTSLDKLKLVIYENFRNLFYS